MTEPVCIGRGSAEYPPLLAELHDPPPQLYLRAGGDPALLRRPCVSVVGSRSCSPYGAQVARTTARELVAAGVVVVSGLARGIDGEAHRGALDGEGETVAVLGCGIDRDYPRSNAELARGIVRAGLVISEYPPGVEPAPWRFPARNRIVAGIALATVVVEARERSGALITADFALELGRDVFAVPGEVTSSLSAGTNDLLRQGAAPLLTTDDVLGVLGLDPVPSSPSRAKALSPAVGRVLPAIHDSPGSVDELARSAGLDSAAAAAALVELELEGLVVSADGIYRAVTPGRNQDGRAPA